MLPAMLNNPENNSNVCLCNLHAGNLKCIFFTGKLKGETNVVLLH